MLRYVTTNAGKVREANEYLGSSVRAVDHDYMEPQSTDLAEIAAYGAETCFEELPGDDPVLVDDAGLFIAGLNGFPGPYSAYVENTLGIERVAALALDEADHSAEFRAVIGFADGTITKTFEGVVRGRIVEPRGDGGFGYDPIFAHGAQTFAELSVEAKNAISHRGRALERFADWFDEPTT